MYGCTPLGEFHAPPPPPQTGSLKLMGGSMYRAKTLSAICGTVNHHQQGRHMYVHRCSLNKGCVTTTILSRHRTNHMLTVMYIQRHRTSRGRRYCRRVSVMTYYYATIMHYCYGMLGLYMILPTVACYRIPTVTTRA